MLVSPSDESPKRHQIECAAGGDPLFYLCILYACNLAFDELINIHNSASRDDDGDGDGGGD